MDQDVNGNIQATPISTINHENNVFLNDQLVTNKIIAPEISFIIFKTTKLTI